MLDIYIVIFFRGGNENVCYSEDRFFENISKNIDIGNKTRTATFKKMLDFFDSKARLSKDRRLILLYYQRSLALP